jgi:hypothetical protein
MARTTNNVITRQIISIFQPAIRGFLNGTTL